MARRYVPDRGDLVWLDFDPQAGHEQAGHRPAIALSPRGYNERTGLALFCPITSQSKGYPFEAALPPGLKLAGVILADQVKSFDWRARNAKRIGRAPADVTDGVLARLGLLLQREAKRGA
jgi:mRNA interferase MazF